MMLVCGHGGLVPKSEEVLKGQHNPKGKIEPHGTAPQLVLTAVPKLTMSNKNQKQKLKEKQEEKQKNTYRHAAVGS